MANLATRSNKIENGLRHKGFKLIAGLDEAGRGPLAGPVVAAAVILPSRFKDPTITDSKKMTRSARETSFKIIEHKAISIGVGIVDVETIDKINILKATLLAMQTAVENLSPKPEFLLIDGRDRLQIHIPQKAVVKGDALCLSIAAASIIAKEIRDRIMIKYHETFPEYGFARHKGYGTAKHLQKIKTIGPCPIHRRSYAPVAALSQI